MKLKFIIITIIIACICVSGCVANGISSSVPPQTIETFGNGVMYAHGDRGDAGYAISNYLKDHPDKRIIAMSSDDTGMYGYTVGYFFIVENRTCES
jgi:hypothetical protein